MARRTSQDASVIPTATKTIIAKLTGTSRFLDKSLWFTEAHLSKSART